MGISGTIPATLFNSEVVEEIKDNVLIINKWGKLPTLWKKT